MNQENKYRHPMFMLVVGALLLYECWSLFRVARTYLSFDRQWYQIPASMQTALIVALVAGVITLIGLIALLLLRKIGLVLLFIGILLGLYGIWSPQLNLYQRLLPLVESVLKFLAVWYAVKAGPRHEEAIHQLD